MAEENKDGQMRPADIPEFPLKGADCCPTCKSTDKLSKKILDTLVKQKKMAPNAQFSLKITVPTGVMGQDIVSGNAALLMIGVEWEICGKCWTMYATNIIPVTVPMPGAPVYKNAKIYRG